MAPGPTTVTRSVMAPSVASAAPVERPRACVSATLLVRSPSGSVAGDPVETQAALLRSRAFYANAPEGVAARRHFRVERLGTSALVSLQVLADEAVAERTCHWIVAHALENADPVQAEARAWLEGQAKEQERRATAAEDALHAYDVDHNLLSISLDDQLELVRSEIKATRQAKAAGRHGLEQHSKELDETALDLDLRRLERQRLSRAAENERRLSETLRDRLGAMQAETLMNPPLRLVDACAPCQGVDYALDE